MSASVAAAASVAAVRSLGSMGLFFSILLYTMLRYGIYDVRWDFPAWGVIWVDGKVELEFFFFFFTGCDEYEYE